MLTSYLPERHRAMKNPGICGSTIVRSIFCVNMRQYVLRRLPPGHVGPIFWVKLPNLWREIVEIVPVRATKNARCHGMGGLRSIEYAGTNYGRDYEGNLTL